MASEVPMKLHLEELEEQQRLAQKRFAERADTRAATERELAQKTPLEVDTAERIETRCSLIDPRDGLAQERLMGRSDLFPIAYLESGTAVANAVCRIEVRDTIGRVLGHGTGFLVSKSLLLTNNHVLRNATDARFSLAQFNYQNDRNLVPLTIRSFRLLPEVFFITNTELDFSLVAVEPMSGDGVSLGQFGFLRLIAQSGKALDGEYVSIIQHPLGAPKAIAVRENEVKDTFDNFVHYATDTEPGSSGSPVFNDAWQVVALHHAGVPDPNNPGSFIANEGIRVSSIMQFLDGERPGLSAGERSVLDPLFETMDATPGEIPAGLQTAEPPLEWYAGSTGYNEAFLGDGHVVPLPDVRADIEQDVAPLKQGNSPVLNYTNFSLLMSKSRRLAYYTAVNVDGSRIQDVPRDSDTWLFDPRIDRKYQSGPRLYSANELDRGHLVRRLDPVWGDRAVEANEDTFHFTNCSPQHKNLNQRTWLGLEDYILKNARTNGMRASVFTGPVFRADDMLYRSEFQIPAEYWKVVAIVKDDGTVSATAYIQTQKNLIEDLEFAYGKYKTYQVPVSRVESLTGLSFGELRTHDPLANIEATVGRVIEDEGDVTL